MHKVRKQEREHSSKVLQSNQNHATITDNGICPTLPASMGMGGGYVPMIAYGVTTKGNGDAFINEQTHTSLSIGGGQAGQGYPCVLVVKDDDDINRQMESSISRRGNVDAPNVRGNRGR